MSLKHAVRVSHIEFRTSETDGALCFGLYAPKSAHPDRALFAGPVSPQMPAELRALADHIEKQNKNKE